MDLARQAPLSMGKARILEWVFISYSRGSSQPMDWTCVSCIGRRSLCHWATREALLIITMEKMAGGSSLKNRLLDTVGKGEGGMIWENSIETFNITICKIDSQWEFDSDTGNPKLCSLTAWRDGVGREVRGFEREGTHCVPMANLCCCVAETIPVLWRNYLPIKIS